jgi:4-carboxymuconolactone decarboxylase
MMVPGGRGAIVRPQESQGTNRKALESLDSATAALVRLSARITGGTETQVREGFAECASEGTPAMWIEELVLQSYLFAGFPRALNAAREWRRTGERLDLVGERLGAKSEARGQEVTAAELEEWRRRGEETCATVYGSMYEKLRSNIRELHPALDEWMIVEGYGKVLSREGLDLPRRELCIVAACVAAGQERQLHSHLHGARNAGVHDAVIETALLALDGAVPSDAIRSAHLLWQRVKGK